MTDLITRLRALPEYGLWDEAADEIERLRAAAQQARAALSELTSLKDMKDRLSELGNMGHGTDWDGYHRRKPLAWPAARNALRALDEALGTQHE